MIYDGDDIFVEAKCRSLEDFLVAALGVPARKTHSGVRLDSCPCCGASSKGSMKLRINSDRHWSCYQCGEHGSIIDAAMQLYADCRTPLAAASYVVSGDTRPVVSPQEIARQREVDTRRRQWAAWAVQQVHEASRASFDRDVLRYLTTVRGLEPAVVQEAWRRGLLGTMPASYEAASSWLRAVVGDEPLRHAGLWKQDAAHPWLAGRPLVQFVDTRELGEFRLIYKPTDPNRKKTLSAGMPGAPFFWRGRDVARCLVVEGCLEMLAAVSMGYAGHVVGTAGTGSWAMAWFKALADTGVSMFDLAFNNDEKFNGDRNAGREAQAELAKQLAAHGLQSCDASPVEPGDINDALLRSRAAR